MDTNRIASSLTVPAADPLEHPGLETRPAEVRAWVEQLPFANPAKVARLIFDPLFHLNRHPRPVTQRPELMHCYQPAFDRLFDALRKDMQNKGGWTLRQREADLGIWVLKICAELAYGHKHIIKDTLKDPSGTPALGRLQRSIYFALKTLSLELMLEYAGFIPGSKRSWREICQLYSLAEQWELLYQPVELESTIDLLFKRAALIALVDPYRLQRNEVWACFDYLGYWGATTKLLRPGKAPKVNGLFVVDLQGMQQTTPYDPDKSVLSDQHRLLNVVPLNQLAHSHMNQIQDAGGQSPKGIEGLPTAEAIQMFRHMLLAWHVLPERRSPREEKYTRHNATCGLSAVNHFLRAGCLIPQDHPPSQESGLELEESITLDGGGSSTLRTTKAHYKVYNWRLFNRSAGGAGIVIAAPFPEELQVGQLVLLELEKDENAAWTVGVVRRMIRRDEDALEIGVQFIQGRPLPAAIRPEVFGREKAADFQPALALDRGTPGAGVLLATRGMFQPRRGFVLDLEQRVVQIFANKLIESTPIFDRFEYGEMVSQRSLSLSEKK